MKQIKRIPTYFGGREAILCPALGGYGKMNERRAKRVLNIQPADSSFKSVCEWIKEVQSYSLEHSANEYSEEALRYLIVYTKPPEYKQILEHIYDIYSNLENNIPLSFMRLPIPLDEDMPGCYH